MTDSRDDKSNERPTYARMGWTKEFWIRYWTDVFTERTKAADDARRIVEDAGGALPVSAIEAPLVEVLAALEHAQWMEWAKNLMDRELLSLDRLNRWHALMVPYAQLTEEQKEQDRVWARKIIAALPSHVAPKHPSHGTRGGPEGEGP